MSENHSAVESVDLAIVGAGIVGASLALAIAREPLFAGIKVILIDSGQPPQEYHGVDFDPRVVALTRNSERFFRDLGVWEGVALRTCTYKNMVVWDGDGTAEIEFNSTDYHQDNLGYIVENSQVVRGLLAGIESQLNVSVQHGEYLESIKRYKCGDSESATANCAHELILKSGRRIRANLVVAADGANSKVRELLDFPTCEWDYGHTAIVTTVRAKKPHQFTAWQRFTKSGPLAFLPLPEINGDKGYCSIVWSVDSTQAPDLMAMDATEFSVALENALESRLGTIEYVAQRYSFPLRQRHAKSYVQEGVALVGDAAHTIHPLAGQGVNLGLLDVQALVAELKRAEQRSLPLTDFSILQRYQRQRMGENLAVMAVMEGFKRLFASQNPVLHLARNWGMNQLQHLRPLKAAIASRAMGL